jgi:adenine/guanine phosphoribosyltransferase-like PRPP-binding protein
MERQAEISRALRCANEDFLRREILKEAVVTNFEKGYISIPSVNQLVDTNLQCFASEIIVDHYLDMGVKIDKVAGIPNAGISLANSVAEKLRVPLAPGRKGIIYPGAWNSRIEINEDVPSFTTGEASKFVFNGLEKGDTVLIIDDFIALGATSVIVSKVLMKHGINVQIAAYAAKIFQGGVKQIEEKVGVKPFYAVGIEKIFKDGKIVLEPPHYLSSRC